MRIASWIQRDIYYFIVLIEKDLKEYLLRYPLAAASSVIFFYAFFIFIYFGIVAIPFEQFTREQALQSSILTGYMIWTVFMSLYTSLSNTIVQESQLGTLEQLFLGYRSFPSVLIFKVYARAIIIYFLFLPLFAIAVFLFNLSLHFSIITFLLFCLLFPMNVFIISLPIVSLSLIFKRLGPLIQIIQFVMISLTMFTLVDIWVFLTPFLPIISFIRQVLVNGIELQDYGILRLLLLFANSIFYFILTNILLKLVISHAKHKGSINQY